MRERIQALPDGQVSLTDPDARVMTTHSNTGTAMVGYNVQVAVDAKHHLIVAHEVTNTGSDRAQISKMAHAAREAMGTKRLKAIADRGTSAARRSRLAILGISKTMKAMKLMGA